MTIVCEIAFALSHPGPRAAASPVGLIHEWALLPELLFLDFYTPVTGSATDPYVDDGASPACLAMLGVPSLDVLDHVTGEERFAAALARMPDSLLTCTAMRRSEHAVAGAAASTALIAPFSYVVRYHRPAEDEAMFVRHYLDTHPLLLARLPRIRNVLCYVPLAWRHPAGAPAADYMLVNEVAFDHSQDFNAAMASPVRDELRAHFREFPPFSGRNTHYPMDRRRIFPRSES
jgi:uncharacterized protein (TIGR02118 family)